MSAGTVTRAALLYKSKVEYGGWTINHVQGCSHGCKYPCYAMSLAKRTGRVKGYEQWCRPEVVENALDLLEDELQRYRGRIDSVHLSFTTDPFMWDPIGEQPRSEVVELTTAIIRRLNHEGIRVTTLTKGVYPDAFIERVASYRADNQYGVSVVSLTDEFQQRWEPGSAPAQQRLHALRRLAEAGAQTWVSVEPYPTPNVDETASDPAKLLEAVTFVDKAVFGRWNYSKLVNSYDGADTHYLRVAEAFAAWSQQNSKVLHIKAGTALSESYAADVLHIGARPTVEG